MIDVCVGRLTTDFACILMLFSSPTLLIRQSNEAKCLRRGRGMWPKVFGFVVFCLFVICFDLLLFLWLKIGRPVGRLVLQHGFSFDSLFRAFVSLKSLEFLRVFRSFFHSFVFFLPRFGFTSAVFAVDTLQRCCASRIVVSTNSSC